MSYLKHEGREFELDLFLEIGPAEYEYQMTGIRYTGPYKLEDYFTPAAIQLIKKCEGTWIQHVSEDTIYMVDIDYNVTEYPKQQDLIRAEQLVQMDTTPFLEPECMHVLEYFEKQNNAIGFDYCVCGEYLVIKSPIDIKAFMQTCKKLGYPVSVRQADGAYMVTDKRKTIGISVSLARDSEYPSP